MSFKSFLAVVTVATLLFWLGCFLIITNTDPASTDYAVALFYSTLVPALFGTLTVAGLLLRRMIINDDTALLRHLKQSLRQAALITGGVALVLKLLSSNLFTWWIGLILVVLIGLVEAIFYSKRTAASGYVY